MREKKKRVIPPRGNGAANMTTEQVMQLVAKKNHRVIEYLKDR